MISIIICSTNETRLERVCKNISETIGVEHEFLIRNNRGKPDGICKVYNELAGQAQGEMLCFVHEDVLFLTQDWGQIIGSQVAKESTGVIGFAGAAAKMKTLSGMMHKYYGECNVIDITEADPIPEKNNKHYTRNNPMPDFAPAVTVDGLFLMTRKEVWEKVKFDDKTFTGFHLYDLDLSTAVFYAGYTNYICHCVNIIHYSRGDYNLVWYQDSLKYNKKWEDRLPFYVNRPSDKRIAKDEKYALFNITYHVMKRNTLPPYMIRERVMEQLKKYPLEFKSYYHAYRYLRYKIEYKNKK